MASTRTNSHQVTATASIDAAPQRVYTIIADYRDGHPKILPAEFDGLTVERGGFGDGTIINFGMRVMGRKQTYRAAITEPEPGRTLVETALDDSGIVTTFTVQPDALGEKSEVTISSEIPVRAGLLGAVQRFFLTRYLPPIYRKELLLLSEIVRR